MGDLVPGVHSGVRAPRDRGRHRLAHQGGQHGLELALDGAQSRLGGPAVEARAVVGEVDADPHPFLPRGGGRGGRRAHNSHARTPPVKRAALGTMMVSSPIFARFAAVIRFELPPPM